MRSLLFVFTAVIFIPNVNATECNYVVDYFWTAVNGPTHAPTDAPSPSPTVPPTSAPTPSPTPPPSPAPTANGQTPEPAEDPTLRIIQLMTTMSEDNSIGSGGSSDGGGDPQMLKPMTFGFCYSFPDRKFYFGDFSLKYTCNSDNNLVRQIYYDTLECDSVNQDVLTVQTWEMGNHNLRYVCNQANDCDFARFVNTSAATLSPTASPTDDPTMSPTPGPTTAPTDSPSHTGTEYPTLNLHPTLVLYVESTERNEWDIAVGGDDEWWDRCDGISVGTDTETDRTISYFVQNICVSADYFVDVFDNYYDSDMHYGWYCDTNKNQYFMAAFTDPECTDMSYKMVAYTNDQCIPKYANNEFYAAYWTYVECGVTVDPFTPSPNEPQMPATAPGNMPAMSPTDPLGNDADFVSFISVIACVFSAIAQLVL